MDGEKDLRSFERRKENVKSLWRERTAAHVATNEWMGLADVAAGPPNVDFLRTKGFVGAATNPTRRASKNYIIVSISRPNFKSGNEKTFGISRFFAARFAMFAKRLFEKAIHSPPQVFSLSAFLVTFVFFCLGIPLHCSFSLPVDRSLCRSFVMVPFFVFAVIRVLANNDDLPC